MINKTPLPLIAIDPGLKGLGWAYYGTAGFLVAAGVARTAAGRSGAWQSGLGLPALQVGGDTGPLSPQEKKRIAQMLMRANEQSAR